VLLISSSGKIVITGGKSVFDVSDGWKALWPTVQRYVCDRADCGADDDNCFYYYKKQFSIRQSTSNCRHDVSVHISH